MFAVQLDKEMQESLFNNNYIYKNGSLVRKYCEFVPQGLHRSEGIPNSCDFLFADSYLTDLQVMQTNDYNIIIFFPDIKEISHFVVLKSL